MQFPVPLREAERLARLRELDILDSEQELCFDRIVLLAAQAFGTPMAVISLVDSDRQWFKAKIGIDASETARCNAFCAHTIIGDGVFTVLDAAQDPRFSANPLVTGDPHIRFYAGAPLITSDGLKLGSLCVIDQVPRPAVTADQQAMLANMAAMVTEQIERRVISAEREAALGALRESEQRFRAASRHSGIGMAIVGLDGRWLEVNDALVGLLGYGRDDLLRRRFQELTHPLDLDSDLHRMEQLLAGTVDSYSLEKRYLQSGGGYVWALLTVSLVRSDNGEPLYFVSQIQDMSEVHRLAAELVEDKARLEDLAQSLDEARAAAEAANRAKSEFLAIMSHELRTPLNGVLGFAQLLGLDLFGALNDKQREFLDHIEKSGNLLLDLVTDVLELSKIEAGHVDLEIRPIDPVTVLKAALANVAHTARANGISLDIDAPLAPVPAVSADALRLSQVLINLLGNAIKYNRPGGSVGFGCHVEGDDVVLTVSDTGIGIAAERQFELFEPFARLGAENTHVEGHGIGLALCKKLTRLMGGTIGASSTEGVGSTFWVRLPVAEREQETAPVAATCTDFDPVAHLRLLHIEDNVTNRELVGYFAKALKGVELLEAATGAAGLVLARSCVPDVVLLDMNLPDMSGLRVLKASKEDHRLRDVPVIIASASAMPDQVDEAIRAGAVAYVPKPLDLRKLGEKLSSITTVPRPQSCLHSATCGRTGHEICHWSEPATHLKVA